SKLASDSFSFKFVSNLIVARYIIQIKYNYTIRSLLGADFFSIYSADLTSGFLVNYRKLEDTAAENKNPVDLY
ncbi:hypothetical protein BpHYR1_023926, partial [Brachionus plicatilis]